jgi:hypothetical protein
VTDAAATPARTLDIDTRVSAETHEPKFGRTITILISFLCGRVFRHVQIFSRTPDGRRTAKRLTSQINAAGGLSIRHVDEYATKPHHTHACQSCGGVWRPAIVYTVGVQFLPGFKNP